jgi:thiol:disulfide interchange protein
MLIEIFLLAVGSMFWPVLFAVDVAAFKSDRPLRILAGFLAGGLVATVSIGIAVVFRLQDTDLVSRSRHTTDAVVSIAVGAAALVAAYFVRGSAKQREARSRSTPHTSSRTDRLVAHGAALAFLTGIVLDLIPGPLPIIALKDIAELGYTTAGTIAVIIGFYLVMFMPVELPILGFLVAPKRTADMATSVSAWLGRNLRTLAWWALAIFGVLEIVRGVIAA